MQVDIQALQNLNNEDLSVISVLEFQEMRHWYLFASVFKQTAKEGPEAPKVSNAKGIKLWFICLAAQEYLIFFLDSADFAKCNGEIIGGVNAPISAEKGWVTVTSAKMFWKLLDVNT